MIFWIITCSLATMQSMEREVESQLRVTYIAMVLFSWKCSLAKVLPMNRLVMVSPYTTIYVEEALPQIGEVLDADLCKEIADLSSRTQSQEQATSTELQNCVFQLLNLGLLCSQEAPKDRPSMQYIYSEIVDVKEHFVSCSVKET